MEFGEKLRKLLRARGLSQADLARRLGTNQPQISRWAQGNKPPEDNDYLLKMARALGVAVDYLIDETQEQPEPALSLSRDEWKVLDRARELGMVETTRLLWPTPGAERVGPDGRDLPPDRAQPGRATKAK